jgi:2-desacetyl-2-hydroxyethyl bacteriochlorophyllide A dehydrogenase
MRAIRLVEPFVFENLNVSDVTAAPAGHTLVRVDSIGICGTDLHGYRGKQPFFTYPRILGHELGVEVIALGAGVSHIKVGDRCSVEPYLNCGQCVACRAGKTNCCTSLSVLGVHVDGGMQDVICVPAHKLHVANDLSFEQLALVETLCIGAHAVDRAQMHPDEWTLVIGAGPIGLSVIEFAKQHTRNLIVMDVNEARLSFVRAHHKNAQTVVADTDAIHKINTLTNNDLPTLVFDATGNAASMMQAFQFVAHGGRLVFVGLVQSDITFHDPHLHRREITLLSSRNAQPQNFTQTIDLIRGGQIDTRAWITHRASADTLIAQFTEWLKPENGVIKAVVKWS